MNRSEALPVRKTPWEKKGFCSDEFFLKHALIDTHVFLKQPAFSISSAYNIAINQPVAKILLSRNTAIDMSRFELWLLKILISWVLFLYQPLLVRLKPIEPVGPMFSKW